VQPTPDQVFGLELRRARERLGISQEQFGFQAGIHRTYVSQLERGLKSPTLGAILKIARALNMPAGTLVAAVEKQLP
jgi:transcriptional regulator with XRE-family HTH domain